MRHSSSQSTKFTEFFKTPMKQHLNLQIENDKLAKQEIATKPKSTHPILIAIYTKIFPMFAAIFVCISIEFVMRDSTPMSEILHDIFSVSPLLILVVAMYLLTMQITKDI